MNQTHLDEFNELMSSGEIDNDLFCNDYLDRVSDRIKSITDILRKLLLMNFVLFFLLYIIQLNPKMEFDFLGYSVKNLASIKDYLLLVFAISSIIASINSNYKSYLEGLIETVLNHKIKDERVRRFYKHSWINDYFGHLPYHDKKDHLPTFLTVFSIASLVFLAFVIIVMYVCIVLVVELIIIYDVYKNPSSDYYTNKFIVFFSVISFITVFLITATEIPQPFRDANYYSELSKLKETNPNKHDEIISKIMRRNKNIEKTQITITMFVSYFSIFYFHFKPDVLVTDSTFIAKLCIGIINSFLIFVLTYGLCKEIIYNNFISKSLKNDNLIFSSVDKRRKIIKIIQYVLPIFLSYISLRSLFG